MLTKSDKCPVYSVWLIDAAYKYATATGDFDFGDFNFDEMVTIDYIEKMSILSESMDWDQRNIMNSLKNSGYNVEILSLKPGEATKSFNTLPSVYNAILNFNLSLRYFDAL